MSTQGEAMADVTDGDREKAWLVLCALPISIPGYSPETVREAQNHLAAALAEAREKAQAPFLRLASDLKDGWSPSADRLADAIRRAAEESQ